MSGKSTTKLTEMLGIKYPIIAGAMAYMTHGEWAATVSNAGGFGLIAGVTCEGRGALTKEIELCRSLTDKPFGVNLALVHRSPESINESINVCIDEGVKFVETVAANPEPYIKRLKKAGVTVLHKCATVEHAIAAEKMGADAVSVVGFEAGGATGPDDMPLSILVPLTVDAVKVPVIACGGVGDGRAFVAALALGACGVQIGTRFMATQECPIHPKFKELLLRTKATETALVKRPILKSYRVIRNRTAEEVLQMEATNASLDELLAAVSGDRMKKAALEGDVEVGIVACGEVVGLTNDIPTVKELIDRIISHSRKIVDNLYRP